MPSCVFITDDIYLSVNFTASGRRQRWICLQALHSRRRCASADGCHHQPGRWRCLLCARKRRKWQPAPPSEQRHRHQCDLLQRGDELGSATAPPFGITASNLAANSYALTAVATAGGVFATSTVVNISVVSPVAVSNSGPAISGGRFLFDYTANAELAYVVESSTNLVN